MSTIRNPIFTSIAFAVALAVAPGAYALQDQGDNEIEFTGGFAHASGSDTGTVNADVSYGYYIAPRINIGLRQTLNYSFVNDGSDTWTASTIPFINYNFETSNPMFRPFIGAFVGGAYNSDTLTGTAGPAAWLQVLPQRLHGGCLPLPLRVVLRGPKPQGRDRYVQR